MSNMFCFQCEQTVGGKGCTVAGACGKSADTSNLQDDLTLALINFALANQGQEITAADAQLMMEGLFTTITNVSFDDVSLNKLVAKVEALLLPSVPPNKLVVHSVIAQGDQLFAGDRDVVFLRLPAAFRSAWHGCLCLPCPDARTKWTPKSPGHV